MSDVFDDFFRGKRVLVTGHTGFKGGWLSLWLKKMGAEVAGFGFGPPTQPNFYSKIREYTFTREFEGDIQDSSKVRKSLENFVPEIVLHLAAQPLVRRSYEDAFGTFLTNTLGSVCLLEQVRVLEIDATVVAITTDKCYENKEWDFSYRENDSLGGVDPYSASKAAAEIMIQSWRDSFFSKSNKLGGVATARAGNVIGGGDYAADRIVPDAIRAVLENTELVVRNQEATRPWQHVLDCTSGYLLLAKLLKEHGKASPFASAFNFGPGPQAHMSVGSLVSQLFREIPGRWRSGNDIRQPHEAKKLNLSIDKASVVLGWAPTWTFSEAVGATAQWYAQEHLHKNENMLAFSLAQITQFEQACKFMKGRR